MIAQRMRERLDHFANRPLGAPDDAAMLRDMQWSATKVELIEFAARTGAALQLLEELYALPDGETRHVALETVLAPLPRRLPRLPGHGVA